MYDFPLEAMNEFTMVGLRNDNIMYLFVQQTFKFHNVF